MKAFEIRFAIPTDIENAIHVVRSVYEEYGFTWDAEEYHADLYDLNGAYLEKGHHFWIAEADGEALGTAALEIFAPIPGPIGKLVEFEGARRIGGCDSALQRLYVHPEARGVGVGSALMQKVILTARELGRRRLEIWSDKRFEAAHRIYGRAGAITVGDRICHDPDQSPEWGLYIPI